MLFDEDREHAKRDNYGLLQSREDEKTILLRGNGSVEPANNWLKCCSHLDLKFKKNYKDCSNKMYHFIIGFAPQDNLSSAQILKIAVKYAKKVFIGYNVLISAHDGKHAHLLVHSTRECNVKPQKYMTRNSAKKVNKYEYLAGGKLSLTYSFIRFLKTELMQLCKRHNLYQIDLLAPAPKRTTNGEYAAIQKDGTSYKHTIRDIIDYAIAKSCCPEEFFDILAAHGISCSQHWDHVKYHLEGTKYHVDERSLGSDYSSKKILDRLNLNNEQSLECEESIQPYSEISTATENANQSSIAIPIKPTLESMISNAKQKREDDDSVSYEHAIHELIRF